MSSVPLETIQSLLAEFNQSTVQSFETMAFTKLDAGQPARKSTPPPDAFISGTISFSGTYNSGKDPLIGSVSLLFPRSFAEKIFRTMMMMGESDPVDAGGLKDAIGELANMATGGAKAALQEKGVNFNIGLPVVVVGDHHHIEQPGHITTYVTPLTAGDNTIFLEMSVS